MANNTLYLHVGWSKTGSSAVQLALHTNRAKYKAHGLLYPESIQWGDHSHHHFSLAFQAIKGHTTRYSQSQAIELLESEYKESGCHSVIVSSELSPFYFSHPAFCQFADRNFDRVVVIFTIRRQSEFIMSLYNQLTKDSRVRYSGSLFTLTIANLSRLNYDLQIKQWSDKVGTANVEVIKYNQHIVKTVHDYFKIECGDDPTGLEYQTNLSVPNEVLIAIKQANKNVNDPIEYNKNKDLVLAMYEKIEKKTHPQRLFSISEQRALDNHFQAGNDNIASLYLDEVTLFPPKKYEPINFIPLRTLRKLNTEL